MIVYSATKSEFNNDVIMNSISDKILSKLIENNIHGGKDGKYRAWQNSLNFMKNVLDDKEFDKDQLVLHLNLKLQINILFYHQKLLSSQYYQ